MEKNIYSEIAENSLKNTRTINNITNSKLSSRDNDNKDLKLLTESVKYPARLNKVVTFNDSLNKQLTNISNHFIKSAIENERNNKNFVHEKIMKNLKKNNQAVIQVKNSRNNTQPRIVINSIK